MFDDELLEITPTFLLFTSPKHAKCLQLDLQLVVALEEEKGGLFHSDKLVLHLVPVNKGRNQ